MVHDHPQLQPVAAAWRFDGNVPGCRGQAGDAIGRALRVVTAVPHEQLCMYITVQCCLTTPPYPPICHSSVATSTLAATDLSSRAGEPPFGSSVSGRIRPYSCRLGASRHWPSPCQPQRAAAGGSHGNGNTTCMEPESVQGSHALAVGRAVCITQAPFPEQCNRRYPPPRQPQLAAAGGGREAGSRHMHLPSWHQCFLTRAVEAA